MRYSASILAELVRMHKEGSQSRNPVHTSRDIHAYAMLQTLHEARPPRCVSRPWPWASPAMNTPPPRGALCAGCFGATPRRNNLNPI
jgi:hypothetical protein